MVWIDDKQVLALHNNSQLEPIKTNRHPLQLLIIVLLLNETKVYNGQYQLLFYLHPNHHNWHIALNN